MQTAGTNIARLRDPGAVVQLKNETNFRAYY